MAQVKPTKKKKMTNNSLIATIVAVVILVAFMVSFMSSTGLMIRTKTGAKTENFSINGAMIDYFAQAALENWYNGEYMDEMREMYGDYYQLFIQYGLGPFNPSKPYDEQIYDQTTGKTYADLFVEKANDYIARLLNLCEAAKADSAVNYAELEAEAKEHAEETLKTIELSAKNSNMDITSYIRSTIGGNLNKNDLKKCLILENIASHYAEAVYDRIYDNMSNADKEEFFKDNIGSFFTAEYLVYTLANPNTVTYPVAADYEGGEESAAYKAAKEAAGDDEEALPVADDYVGGENSKAYKEAYEAAVALKEENDAQKAIDKVIIEKLGNAKTENEFITIILEANYDKAFNSAYDKLKLEEANEPSDEALEEYKNSIKDSVISAVIGGLSNIVVVDKNTDAEAKTVWDEKKTEIPTAVISTLTSTLESATQTTSYTVSSNHGQKIFGGVKAEYGVPYESYEVEGTNALVGDIWTEDTMLSNKEAIVNALEIYKDMLNDEENDPKEVQSAIDSLETSLEKAEKELSELDKTGHYSYSAFCVTEAAHREEENTRHVGHILFQVDDSGSTTGAYASSEEAKKAAEAYLEQIKDKAVNGVVSKETFEEMGAVKTADSSVFYENVYRGQMVAEFEDWLFSAENIGDLGLVETDYGWHIMYYGGEGEEPIWQYLSHLAASNEDYAEWEEGLDYGVTVEESLLVDIFNN